MSVVAAVLGMLLIFATLVDVMLTLVATQSMTGRLWPSKLLFRGGWAGWRTIATRAGNETTRERILMLFAPFSVLMLLVLWLGLLLFGWALVFQPFRAGLDGSASFTDDLYYSGVALLTIGFGDIRPVSSVMRFFSLFEAATGLGTVALAVSYLPSLYASYNRRESRLLTLDHPSGERVEPVSLVILRAPDGDLDRLYRFFADWELWTADVMESHTSYPMLAMFRSQQPAQSWVTGLGVVLDAAALVSAVVPGAEEREPYLMYLRGRRAVQEIGQRLEYDLESPPTLDRGRFDAAVARLAEEGLPARDAGDAWDRFVELERAYGPMLRALADHLLTPAGFWGLSAEETETGASTPPPGALPPPV